MAESLLVIPWGKVDPGSSSTSGGAERSAGNKLEQAQEKKEGAIGLKRSGTVMSASASSVNKNGGSRSRAEGGEAGAGTTNRDDDDKDDDEKAGARRETDSGTSTAVKNPNNTTRGDPSSRRGVSSKSLRGRKKLFQVDIAKEEDDDDDEEQASDDVGKPINRFPRNALSTSPTQPRTNLGVGKHATPTIRDLEASGVGKAGSTTVPSNLIDSTAGDSEESDESDDSEGNSDPEEAVNPGKTLVDSDEEDEKMVEDVGAVKQEEKGKD
jgi:hypothetical protein